MVEAIRAARSHVHLMGWHLSPDFVLEPGPPPLTVRDLLDDASRRVPVRVLLWAGAPLPVFKPSRRAVRRVRDDLRANTGVRCALDRRERPLHCHHEKAIVIDDRHAFVGGIDLTALAGDRRDSSRHPPRQGIGWHDVATAIRGPLVSDVAAHFNLRWAETTGERLRDPAPAPPAGEVTAQLVRTCPEHVYRRLPHGEFSVLESYARAFRSAQRLVYLENQYLWSPEIVAILAEKLRHPPDPRFRLLLVLPAKPSAGQDDTRGALGELIEADGQRGRILACCLVVPAGAAGHQVYVHAKVGIVDDRWLTVGSANLNNHSLFNDTELNIVTHDPALARQTRLSLWAEHLEAAPAEVDGDPTDLIDQRWSVIAERQLHRHRAGQPPTHRLMRLDHASRRSARLAGPLQGLLVDG